MINLTESGFHPLTLEELLTEEEKSEMNRLVLGYGQTDGSHAVKTVISNLYDGAGPENILVTNGSAEANFVAVPRADGASKSYSPDRHPWRPFQVPWPVLVEEWPNPMPQGSSAGAAGRTWN